MDGLNRRDFLKGSLKAGTAMLGMAMIVETASGTLIKGTSAAEAAGSETEGGTVTRPGNATVRFPAIPPEQMTDAQKNMYESIANGPRGGFRGPYGPLLYSAETGNRMQKLGEHLRYNSSLPPRLSEYAILITGRFGTANYEWSMHRPQAIKAGLAESIIEDLLHNKRPEGMQPDEGAIYDFCTALHKKHTITDALFEQAVSLFGEQGIVDLIGLCGYYTMIAMVLNVAEIPAPPGGESPW